MSVIVSINHETGDLTQYTLTVTDSGDLSVAAGAALAGTNYGLSVLIDDATAIYGRASAASSTGIIRERFYIDPNGLTMGDGDLFVFNYLYKDATTPFGRVELNYTIANGYGIRSAIVNDSATFENTSYFVITDAPHYVELQIVRASSNVASDGTLELWIDGVSKQVLSGKDNYDKFDAFGRVYLGALAGMDAGTSGTFYLDELVVNDDGGLIGPVVLGNPWYAYAMQ